MGPLDVSDRLGTDAGDEGGLLKGDNDPVGNGALHDLAGLDRASGCHRAGHRGTIREGGRDRGRPVEEVPVGTGLIDDARPNDDLRRLASRRAQGIIRLAAGRLDEGHGREASELCDGF